MVATILIILCVQSVTAQLPVFVWTDKPQYNPGETGTLEISILNERDEPVEINNITIIYPWHVYDADKGEWVGNETIKGDNRVLATMTSKGDVDDHYYTDVKFTVPTDGRAIMSGSIAVYIWTSKGIISESASLSVAAPSWPMALTDLDTWMTYLIVAVVVCAIILAIVVMLSSRGPRASSGLTPRALAPPPPPKPKAKA